MQSDCTYTLKTGLEVTRIDVQEPKMLLCSFEFFPHRLLSLEVVNARNFVHLFAKLL